MENTLQRLIEWDENKNRSNKIKHGVDFQQAAKVFEDIFRLEEIDEAHSDEETRYITIGRVNDILFVVYTERGEFTRLISARRATKNERRRYLCQSLEL